MAVFFRHLVLLGILLTAIFVQIDAQASESPGEEVPLTIDSETSGLKTAPPAAVEDDQHFLEWSFQWDAGFQYQLKQKAVFSEYTPWHTRRDYRKVEGRLGVKLHVDAAVYNEAGDVERIPSDHELRRGRVYTLGNTYFFKPLDYRVEFGFSGSEFFFSEGYVRWNEVPWVRTVQFGQFKAPMSLEMMGSSGATIFMERGLPVLAFAPGSRLGSQIGGPFLRERMTLVLGTYASVSDLDVGDATDGAVGPMGRFTWSPVHKEEGGVKKLVHVGASASYSQSYNDYFRYRSQPESHIAPYLVDTGVIDGDKAFLYGLEAAGVAGPLCIQGEFLLSIVNGDEDSSGNFRGFYTSVSWFLTGESRPYNENRGLFSRIRPQREFSLKDRHWGAWEIAARASMVNLSDKEIHGGKLRDITGGLNWYWTSNSRLMFNYVYSDIDDTPASGTVHVFQTRLQIEF